MSAPADRSRRPAGIREGGQFATAARDEASVHLDQAQAAPPVLTAALEKYGLTVVDVPLDHEGQAIAQRWEETAQDADQEPGLTVEDAVNRLLGHPEYGRHRGGPDLVWWDPAAASDPGVELYCANDPDDPRWDDPTATLAAWVHTRNGGGNRDCYCETEEHRDGCLAVVNEALQDHDAYLADHDDTGDYTYANFYFRIDDRQTAHAALRDVKRTARQRQATRLLSAIEAGTAPPWMVMPRNPQTVDLVAAARSELDAMGTEDMPYRSAASLGIPVQEHAPGYGRPVIRHIRASTEHLNDVDALMQWSQDPTGQAPDLRAKWASRSAGAVHQLRSSSERAAQTKPKAQVAAAARKALEDGTLPPGVDTLVRDSLDSVLAYGRAESDHARALADVAKHRDALAALRPELEAAAAAGRRREELRALTAMKDQVLRWPGTPDTVPAAQETVAHHDVDVPF